MGMVGASVDPKISELHTRKRSAWQHALDGFLDDPLRKLALEYRARGALLDAADIAGVMTVDLLFTLLAGEHNFFRVYDNDVVAIVYMRRVGRLVLAAQPHGHNRRQTADDEAGGVDLHPFFLDIDRLGRVSLHRSDLG